MQEQEHFYSLISTAKILDVTVRTLRYWISKGTLKAFKYKGGTMWFVSQSEIDRITAERKA